jgi:hypothetical protein
MKEFSVTDNRVSGRVSTGGELDAFDQKWEVDLTFSAPLPKGAFAATSEPAPADPKEAGKEEAEDAAAASGGPKPPVGQLPLPAAARDVEYKEGVEQISFRADASVSAVANDFGAKLKKQGWKELPGGLMTKSNAILKRSREGAELTVIVQSSGSGCTVKILTEGLDWSATPASSAAKPAKPGNVDEIGNEAKRLIDDALKKIPRGLR